MPIGLWVFVLPGHREQVVTEVYRDRVWDGPDWTLYLLVGMGIGLLFGIAGVVLATARLVLWLRSAKDPKTIKLRYGAFFAGVALGVITVLINSVLFLGLVAPYFLGSMYPLP